MENVINQCRVFENGQILTPVCRLSWLSIDKPKASMNDPNKLRFQATLLFDTAQVDVTPIVEKAEALALEAFGKNWRQIKGLHMPLKDGGAEGKADLDGYGAGIWYIDTKSIYAPKLFSRDRQLCGPEIFYAGCYARCLGSLYSYAPTKSAPMIKTGVAFGFNALQFVNDGEPFGGGGVNADMFDAID